MVVEVLPCPELVERGFNTTAPATGVLERRNSLAVGTANSSNTCCSPVPVVSRGSLVVGPEISSPDPNGKISLIASPTGILGLRRRKYHPKKATRMVATTVIKIINTFFIFYQKQMCQWVASLT